MRNCDQLSEIRSDMCKFDVSGKEERSISLATEVRNRIRNKGQLGLCSWLH